MGLPLGALLFGASTGASIHQGQKAAQQGRRAVRAQKDAQRSAEARAISENRRAEEERRRLNRRRPDVASLLGEEREAAQRGPASTLLTGSSGVSRRKLTLGSSSLLGGA
jgi:hypothetical protein